MVDGTQLRGLTRCTRSHYHWIGMGPWYGSASPWWPWSRSAVHLSPSSSASSGPCSSTSRRQRPHTVGQVPVCGGDGEGATMLLHKSQDSWGMRIQHFGPRTWKERSFGRGAQLPALGELSHRRGGAPALRVAFLHRPALGASLLGGLRLLEPLPQLHLPVFLLSPALPPQLRPQCRGEPRVASAHLCLLLRGLHHPRKCFHCVHCLIPRAHAPHLHSLAVDQEAHSKSGGSQVLQLETAALHHQLHLLLLGAGCLLSAQHVL
ncbi:acyltransferase PGAP2 isoform X17 [Homo sapiens]|nr:post-GPI attachment to proteins factor 2 isoform X17 [Homo sapiens]XP_054224429.1 post-GPI attachment to proteins factor 2 isoform X17 [Homo sapiens]|eukprot:XP_016873048.1 post-GPI attachment to proteins factor 2 isoform X16 [Homo sapiens]